MLYIVQLWYIYGGDCSAIIGVHAASKEAAEFLAKSMLLKEYEHAHSPLEAERVHHVEAKLAAEGVLFLDEA